MADALVKGKIIRIRIGDVQVGVRQKDLPYRKDLRADQLSELDIREKILKFSPKSPTIAQNKSNK